MTVSSVFPGSMEGGRESAFAADASIFENAIKSITSFIKSLCGVMCYYKKDFDRFVGSRRRRSNDRRLGRGEGGGSVGT